MFVIALRLLVDTQCEECLPCASTVTSTAITTPSFNDVQLDLLISFDTHSVECLPRVQVLYSVVLGFGV